MNNYIIVLINDKPYRFLLNAPLEEKLKDTLKDKYEIDNHDYLVTDHLTLEEKYEVKQILFERVLNELHQTNLTEKERIKFQILEEKVTSKKNTVYNSDLIALESALNDLGELFKDTRNREAKPEQTQKLEINKNSNTTSFVGSSTHSSSQSDNTSDSTDNKDISELKELLNDIAKNTELKNAVPTEKLNEVIDKIKICTSDKEYEELTGNKASEFRVEDLSLEKIEAVILPPSASVSEVFTAALSTYCSSNTITKVATLASKDSYTTKVQNAFDKLRSDIKVKGLNARNLNYFGDDFLDQFEALCQESGIDMESMFADYFNGYDANKKYNTALDRFIRQFIKYNGGDENTRAMLEALIVKKAVSRHLISSKYNRYLSDEYRYTEVTGSGYVRFQDRATSEYVTSTGGTEESISQNLIQSERLETSATLSSDLKGTTNSQLNINTTANTNIVNTPSGGIDGVNPNIEFRANEETTNKFQGKTTDNLKRKGINESGFNNEEQSNGEVSQNGSMSIEKVAAIQQKNRLRKGVIGAIGGAHALGAAADGAIGETTSQIEASENVAAPLENYRKNNYFNNRVYNGVNNKDNSESFSNEFDNNEENFDNDYENPNDISNKPSDLLSDNINNNENIDSNNPLDAAKGLAKDAASKALGAWLKKHKLLIIGIGGGIFLFLILLIAILGGGNEMNNGGLGYMDEACNYNAVNVTLTSCDGETDLLNTSLDDFILKISYLYTKNASYDDEVIKAMMIVLKTNTLSYGNYSSGISNIEVPVCKLKDDFDETEEEPFAGFEKAEKSLGSLYNSINEYLYISSSYKSSINSLSSRNALEFNTSKLEGFADVNATYETILSSSYKNNEAEEETIYRETLFIGDSRTHGMNLGVNEVNDNNSVYATGKGYNWFTNEDSASSGTNAPEGGLNEVSSKLKDNVPYNIIIWLGINDLHNINKYFNKYQELAENDWKNHEIYVVSVGPVNDEASSNLKNSEIDKFNSKMKELINNASISNLHYLDLNISENDIAISSDGIHYEASAYKKIYDIIMSNIDTSISGNLSLYKLTDYCTYYNLTENESYWWPIGSANATSGNIYGGDPVSTNITSYFGPRIHPITHVFQSQGHGALDIGSVGVGTPVIATKDGTIETINTGCSEGNEQCGGAYGNFVLIKHDDSISSRYAHLSEVLVSPGDTVKQGQIIGKTGNTGRSTGPHLHFEIILNGTRVDPLNYVSVDNPRPLSMRYTGTGTIVIVGDNGDYSDTKQNKTIVCKSLLASGYSVNATAGIIANMQTESASTFSPEIVEYGSGYNYNTIFNAPATVAAGFGIVQWSWGRRIELIDYANNNNWKPASMIAQLSFMQYELNNKSSYSVTNKYVTGSYPAYDTAVAYCKNFERPVGSTTVLKVEDSCTTRANNNAAKALEYVAKGCHD